VVVKIIRLDKRDVEGNLMYITKSINLVSAKVYKLNEKGE
jgi:hypothetical protein